MTDVYAIIANLIFLALTYPALLLVWRLFFPEQVQRARSRITKTPWKSFGFGIASALLAAIPAAILFSLPAQLFQVLGWIWIVLLLALSSSAAAGISAELGDRIQTLSGSQFSELGSFLRGAAAWEFASVFPVIGWLLVLPAGLLLTLGAGVFAFFHWEPRSRKTAAAQTVEA